MITLYIYCVKIYPQKWNLPVFLYFVWKLQNLKCTCVLYYASIRQCWPRPYMIHYTLSLKSLLWISEPIPKYVKIGGVFCHNYLLTIYNVRYLKLYFYKSRKFLREVILSFMLNKADLILHIQHHLHYLYHSGWINFSFFIGCQHDMLKHASLKKIKFLVLHLPKWHISYFI